MRSIPLLLLCLACDPAVDDTVIDPPDGDSDTDTDADSDTDADADADADADVDLAVVPSWDPADFTTVWEVGPGLDYEDPCDCPWESLQPDTLVRIHGRAEPYACKWAIDAVASEDSPVVVLGVDEPVITGDAAATPQALDFWSESRGVIKIGGTSTPGPGEPPAWIWVQGLEIRSAHPDYGFTDDRGAAGSYDANAAAIFVEEGSSLSLVDNTLHDCGNGLFVAADATDVRVVANHIHGNGIDGSAYYHNSYTEALGITFEYNRYGALREGSVGNNLKDRSAGTVIRYNWIEGGNRQLDLVEADDERLTGDPSYGATFVYGNLLVEHDGDGNSQIVHYGGDNGDTNLYRKGTLHFFHNTVLSLRDATTTLVRLSTDDESADVRDNIVHATAGGGYLAVFEGSGSVALRDNWITAGFTDTHEASPTGALSDLGNIGGSDPGFEDLDALELALQVGSDCQGAAGEPAAETAEHPVDMQYLEHRDGAPRASTEDLGAYEG